MNPTTNDALSSTADRAAAPTVSGDGFEAPRWVVSLFLTSLALWVGAAVYLSAGVLPLLFTSLEPAEAGRIAALVFPTYFRAGLVVGIVSTLCAALLARRGGRRWQIVFVLLLGMTLAQGWSALVLHPEMAGIRGVADQVERFQALHKLSVRLNGIVLLGGMLLLAAGGFLLTPRRGRA